MKFIVESGAIAEEPQADPSKRRLSDLDERSDDPVARPLRRHELGHARIGIYSGGRFSRPHPEALHVQVSGITRDGEGSKSAPSRERDEVPALTIAISHSSDLSSFLDSRRDSQPTLSRCSLRPKPISGPPSHAVNHGRSCCGKFLPATRVRWAEPVLCLRRGLMPKPSITSVHRHPAHPAIIPCTALASSIRRTAHTTFMRKSLMSLTLKQERYAGDGCSRGAPHPANRTAFSGPGRLAGSADH